MTLTEQWKKGELEWGKNYYCRNVKTNETNICFLYGSTWYSADSDGEGDIDWQGYVEVLAPVPTYEEWQQLHKFLEEFNALDVAKENQQLKEDNRIFEEKIHNSYLKIGQLKELLKECREQIYLYKDMCHQDGYFVKEPFLDNLMTKIDNAIGEKK